jgi:uncharacterized protein YcfJ
MTPFEKRVATIALCLSAGALFGAYIAHGRGDDPLIGAGVGAVVGILFGLVAGGELKGGRVFDALFPPGDAARRRDPL